MVLAIGGTTAANSYVYIGQTPEGGAAWKDTACGTSDSRFIIKLYEGPDYTGRLVIICSAENEFCNAPQLDSYLCPLGFTGISINDTITSVKVINLPNGCQLRLYRDAFYEGPSFIFVTLDWIPNLSSVGFNNTASSTRRVGC